MFGRYRLQGLLGAGGMGQVFRAHDTQLHREVAIKVLPPQAATDATFEQRFRREARTAAALDEPHVIPIFDSGEINGRLFIAMQLINGTDIASLLSHHGPMPPEQAVSIVEQAAAALDAAHDANLVHRDVKPANLLVAPTGFVYLIDFGIARTSGQTKLTGTGAAIGTLAYMAPERFLSGQADKRADIYALTCVLYECLTGTTPYPAKSVEQQMFAHVNGPPPRPSLIQPSVPTAFDYVIAHGMARDPDQRYQSAGALAAAARTALHGTATPPQPATVNTVPVPFSDDHDGLAGALAPTQSAIASPSQALPRTRSRRRVVAAIIAAAIVVLAATTSVTYWAGDRRDRPAKPAKADNNPTPVSASTPRTVTATIKVGDHPGLIAVDPTTHTVYLTQPVEDTVAVIDPATNTIATTVKVGEIPAGDRNTQEGVAVDPAAHTLYAAKTRTDGTVAVIDTTTNTVTATIKVGEFPMGIAVDPTSHTAYAVNAHDDTVSAIDTTTNTVTATIKVGKLPMGIAVDPASHTAYVTNSGDDTVSVIDTTTNTISSTVYFVKSAHWVAVDPTSHTAYVTNYTNQTVSAIDTTTNAITTTIKVSGSPEGIAVDPTSHTAYVVNSTDDSVSLIDTTANSVAATIKVGRFPDGIAVDSSTHTAYVVSRIDNTVSVIAP
ncbi:protein kinase [Mycobacterium sp. pUA109]|uniref:protein kinase domain-containing protein n=1 Tax=Mycobacterium sp. pUA109 TaxID=3238982 RepID=UPI00351B0FCC